MKKLQKMKMSLLLLALAVFFGVLLWPEIAFAWGDNGGGRKAYSKSQIEEGVLGDKIVFNSIKDDKIEHEFDFVRARKETDGDGEWSNDEITVEDGEIYQLQLYVHNNNPKGEVATAENVHVAFSLPMDSARDLEVNGFIDSSNAAPSEYWDYVNFHSDTAFHLEYIYGSARLENNGIGNVKGGLQLSDDIVKAASGGTPIGYDKIDGRVPGGCQYDNFVSIRVKVVFDTDFLVKNQARIVGDADQTWKDEIEAEVGDVLEFRMEYVNTSDDPQKRVVMQDVFPDGLQYVSGSTLLYNGNYPDGVHGKNSDAIAETGVVVGSYDASSNAIVFRTAKVVDHGLSEGLNRLTAYGRTAVNDEQVMCDNVRVFVFKPTATAVVLGIMRNIAMFAFLACVLLIVWLKIRHYRLKRRITRMLDDMDELERLMEQREED